jgi:hypothetical protein
MHASHPVVDKNREVILKKTAKRIVSAGTPNSRLASLTESQQKKDDYPGSTDFQLKNQP